MSGSGNGLFLMRLNLLLVQQIMQYRVMCRLSCRKNRQAGRPIRLKRSNLLNQRHAPRLVI